jgi:hypothetical protein
VKEWETEPQVSNVLVEFYRCPEDLVALSLPEEVNPQLGSFHFGPETICYGQSAFSSSAKVNGNGLPDLSHSIELHGSTLRLPFDASAILDNLRFERYLTAGQTGMNALLSSDVMRQLYYQFRSMLPDSLRKRLQRLYFRNWNELPFPNWPVDTSVEKILERLLLQSLKFNKLESIPFIWFWPDGAPAAVIVTHDVETSAGMTFIPHLMDLDDAFGIKTSFQLVPEQGYLVSRSLRDAIRERKCEVNVHGLNHDGNLFRDRKNFVKQSKQINQYVQEFGAEGFRSPCMYRNTDWLQELNIVYDMSVPNVAHLEPQRGGCCTVFPYFIGRILELPLTTIQDYSLFHMLGDYSIELWKKQIALILEKHGLASFITHPDYLVEEKARATYKTLLGYLSTLRDTGKVWMALPGDVNRWWRERSQMELILEEGQWRIKGSGKERARIGYASIKDDCIVYTVAKGAAFLLAGLDYWLSIGLNCCLYAT